MMRANRMTSAAAEAGERLERLTSTSTGSAPHAATAARETSSKSDASAKTFTPRDTNSAINSPLKPCRLAALVVMKAIDFTLIDRSGLGGRKTS
jgi:hypothetical protein